MGVRIARWAGLSTVLAVGLALSACGTYPPPGSKPAAQVVPALQAATESADSVHVAGTVMDGKQTTTIDVSIRGNSVAGYLGSRAARFYVLSLNGDSFVKLDAAFLRSENAPASLCAKVCGKYVELPAASVIAITSLLSMPQLDNQVFGSATMTEAARSGCAFSPATINGQSVLQCRQDDYTLAVAAQGQPYLVYWSGPGGQHLAFSHWNAVVLPPSPSRSQVISISAVR